MVLRWMSKYAHPEAHPGKRARVTTGPLRRHRLAFESLDERTVLSATLIADAPVAQPAIAAQETPGEDIVINLVAPEGADAVVFMQDTTYVFRPEDFGFADPADSPADMFTGIVISSLPQNGTLRAFGSGVAQGQVISFQDLSGGELSFQAFEDISGASYSTFTFQVQDNGPPGQNTDPTPNTFTLFFDDAENNFMRGLYGDLFNRAPDAGGLRDWLDRFNSGVSRQEIANALWETPEHRAIQVTQFYDRFLGRAPDPAGLQNWVNAMQSGLTEVQAMGLFMATDEYRQAFASTQAFVTQVYRDVLLREPDAAGLTNWINAIDQGQFTQAQFVTELIGTRERNLNLVSLYYQDFFNRAPDAFGLEFWTNALDDGLFDEQRVAVELLATNEYFGIDR